MLFVRRCPVSGRKLVREIPVTPTQLMRWAYGAKLKDAAPRLTREEREFVEAGCPKRDLGW